MTEIAEMFAASLAHSNVRPLERPVRVFYGSVPIADTDQAQLWHQRGLEPVVFVPRTSLHPDLIVGERHPGAARHERPTHYESFTVGGQTAENAIWSFATNADGLDALVDYVAFDPNQVQIETAGESDEDDGMSNISAEARAARLTSLTG